MTEEEQSYSVDPGLNLELEKGSDLELVPPTFQLQDQYGQTTIDLNLNADNVSLNGSVNEHNNSLNELQHIVSVEGGKQLNNGDIAIQLPLMFPSDTASNHSSNEMVLNIPSNPDASTDENRLSQSLYSETGSYTESSDRARNYSHGSEDSASIISEAEKRGTFTKKIPLSEFATLQGILAHQVDEGAPCLKCEPGKCSGLELHFWKKVCKSCGCPRGCHKIQRLVEDKKEAPKSILLQTADEDEEDYKEIEILAPPKGFLLQSKTERQNAATEAAYKEEYINRLKEFYSGRKALHISEEEKLTPEQIFILQNYINQTQGTEVISPEVLQNSIHSLAKHSGPTYQYGSDDNIAIKRTQSVSSILSSDSEVNLNQGTPPPKLLQVIQHLTLNPDQGSLGNRSPSPSQHPIIKDQYTNPATLNMSGGRGSPGRGTPNKEPVVRRDDDYSDSRSEDSLTDSRSHSDYTSSEGSRTRSEYTTEDSYTKELSTVNEEDEYTRSSNNKARGRGSPRILKQQDITEENSTIDMIDRITDVSRLHNTETVIRNRSYSDKDRSSDSDSRGDVIIKAPPPKPIRRNPGSFDDLTQGDIIDYYTNVNPSGEPAATQSMKRKGSPGVWVPPGLDAALVKQYLAALPEDKRPVNTLGVQWRIKQLQTQLPRYDHNINYCHEMSQEEQEELFMFVENRKEKAQGQGEVKAFRKKDKKKCEACGGLIDVGIIADKVPGKAWHPGCFQCNTCSEILVDLIYFQHEGLLHCGRHHAELLRPRCHACDELIFGYEFITADNHEYHKEHFCCWECDTSLGGTRYVSHKGQPYCQVCYEKLFCQRCVSCKEPIGVGMPVYKHGPLRWHGNPSCYACSFCKRSLVNRTFMPTERYVYCSKNCYRCHDSLRKTKGK